MFSKSTLSLVTGDMPERRIKMRINFEEVVAVKVGNEEVCKNCVTAGELQDASPDDFTTEHELENSEEMIYCDRCESRFN